MTTKQLQPRKALNKAYLKVKPNRKDIERFKENLIKLFNEINAVESEEYHKNSVSRFLENTYYAGAHYINTKGRKDLVIHNGKDAKTSVGVILEAKKPTNKAEMPGTGKNGLNTKAMQELLLYYLRERVAGKNLEIKHLIITNCHEWFIFDANVFEKWFAGKRSLIKDFEDFEAGRLAGKQTDFFYKEIAEKAIAEADGIEYTYFDLRDYEKIVRNEDLKDDQKLIVLFKLLSPEHLLKLPFANDSNSLDKGFYSELLHIIGLKEEKDGGKKIIRRCKPDDRLSGSLLENTILQLDTLDKISRLDNPAQYGATYDERLFTVGLELVITWVNRILFLKLLEAQLIAYHKGDKTYAFLNSDKVRNLDDLNTLFFQVLAKRSEDRNKAVLERFERVPYLNSSLFEMTDIEHTCFAIGQLDAEEQLPVLSSTVLRDDTGKKITGTRNTLDYFFAFLNSYDFAGEGSEDIQEDNKTLINASVLGLIFEKINGYKDGSFFTPGFITMYMCRETIRKAVVQKFNEAISSKPEGAALPPLEGDKGGGKYHDLTDIYNAIGSRGDFSHQEANALINDIKICDPAVGSGHFLVSALNEMIAVKHDLGVLHDRQGKLLRDYDIAVVNDELIVTDYNGELFAYHPNNRESQRIQETLFHEKQTIIENCLFGVDINPNSVKICRLRLWIELLKNAYYMLPANSGAGGDSPSGRGIKGEDIHELQTLPNIDINIKCGNSLISRFGLDADLKQALKQSKWNIDSYRIAVQTYRNAQSKEEKREMERLIADIKSNFRSEINKNDPKVVKLYKLKGELMTLTTQTGLFERSRKETIAFNKATGKLTDEITKLETEVEEIKSNKIYENAFEWRFEFPEVLDNEGNFVGFDVVIGNPPYVQLQSMKEESKQLQKLDFETYNSMGDLYALFYERGNQILRPLGYLCFITGSAWMRSNYGLSLRKYFIEKTVLTDIIDLSDCDIFDSATVLTSIVSFTKSEEKTPIKAIRFTKKDQAKLLYLKDIFEREHTVVSSFPEGSWVITDSKTYKIKLKVEEQGTKLVEWGVNINRGILTGYNEAFVIDEHKKDELIAKDPKSSEILKPLLRGRDIGKYQQDYKNLWLISTFPSKNYNIDDYSAVKEYLMSFGRRLHQTGENGSRKKTSGQWFEIQDSIAYWEEFEKPKIIYPNMTKFLPFTLDKKGFYTNQKCFILTGDNLEFLVSFFNSKLFRFCFEENFPELQGNTRELNKVIFEQIPIKIISEKEQKPFIDLVNQILLEKETNPSADTTALETEIDQLVYALYGLTEEEIGIVENS